VDIIHYKIRILIGVFLDPDAFDGGVNLVTFIVFTSHGGPEKEMTKHAPSEKWADHAPSEEGSQDIQRQVYMGPTRALHRNNLKGRGRAGKPVRGNNVEAPSKEKTSGQ